MQAGGPLRDTIRSVFIRFYIVFYFNGKYKYSFAGWEKYDTVKTNQIFANPTRRIVIFYGAWV